MNGLKVLSLAPLGTATKTHTIVGPVRVGTVNFWLP